MSELGVSRRNLICGFVAAGVSVPLVAACGSSGSTSGPSAGGATTSSGAAETIPTSEIPVGSGKIFPDKGLIVTQPTAGEFKAFSSTCTHQGAQINSISDGVLTCPLHHSQFSLEGAVEQGPATQPLMEKSVKVTGANLTVS